MLESLPEYAQNQALPDYLADTQDELQWDHLVKKAQSNLVAKARLAKQQIAGQSRPLSYDDLGNPIASLRSGMRMWASERFVSDDPRDLVGPPYMVAEHVFDEYSIEGCYASEDEVSRSGSNDGLA